MIQTIMDIFLPTHTLFAYLEAVADPWALLFIAEAFLLFYLAKWVKDKLHPSFQLDKELLINDNPALALASAGYWFGIGIILWTLLTSPFTNLFPQAPALVSELAETFIWGVMAILLLNLSVMINDKILLHSFSNIKEIIQDVNVGLGAIHCGTYVAAALVIRPFIATPSLGSFYIDFLMTILFFVLAQIEIYIFFRLYAKWVGFSLLKEIEENNFAAGVGLALSLTAIANIIAFPLYTSYNIFLFVLYFINGTIILLLSRVITDKLILSKSSLRDEIVRDKNWGAALIEGTLALAISFVIIGAFSLQN